MGHTYEHKHQDQTIEKLNNNKTKQKNPRRYYTYRHTGERSEVLAEDVHQLTRPRLVGRGAGYPQQSGRVVDDRKRLRCLRPVIPGAFPRNNKSMTRIVTELREGVQKLTDDVMHFHQRQATGRRPSTQVRV